MSYKCPTCGDRRIDVSIRTWAFLVEDPDDPESFETDIDEASNHDHEWDDESTGQCRICGHTAPMADFNDKPTDAWIVVQEGGSSSEIYAHSFDCEEGANLFRMGCSEGGYRTGKPVKVPAFLVDDPNFGIALEEILKTTLNLECVKVPEVDEDATPT